MTGILQSKQLSSFHITFDVTNDVVHNLLELYDNTPNFTERRSIQYVSEQFNHYLIKSTELERDIIRTEVIHDVSEYLEHERYPNIEVLYNKLLPNRNCFRSHTDKYEGFVGVGKSRKRRYEDFHNVGMKASEIEPDVLQKFVNEYYNYEFETEFDEVITGFVCYLLYERVHPHHDGNGRMGRLLFIENTYCKEYYPLSKMLTLLKVDMNDIFKHSNFPGRVYHDDISNFHFRDRDEYYNIVVNDELLTKIVKCICLCQEMKYLYDSFDETFDNNHQCKHKKEHIISKILRRKIDDDILDSVFGDDNELREWFYSTRLYDNNHNKIVEL